MRRQTSATSVGLKGHPSVGAFCPLWAWNGTPPTQSVGRTERRRNRRERRRKGGWTERRRHKDGWTKRRRHKDGWC